MNNVFISSAKKDEAVENFVKNKREELEKMVPGFVDDRKFTDIVLNFYERGIRDGAQMIAVVHNPLLIYALSKMEHIHFIELTKGYVKKVKKQVDAIVK